MFKNFLWYLLLVGSLFLSMNTSYSKLLPLSFSWETVKSKVLSVETQSFNFHIILPILFLSILFTNLGGLLVLLPQNFIYKISLSLLIMALSFWMYTYTSLIKAGKEKLTLFVIGEMKFPVLSLLLSHIEILTHLFRPITLTARLWVNIWVGHLIMSGISFVFCSSVVKLSLNPFFWGGGFSSWIFSLWSSDYNPTNICLLLSN